MNFTSPFDLVAEDEGRNEQLFVEESLGSFRQLTTALGLTPYCYKSLEHSRHLNISRDTDTGGRSSVCCEELAVTHALLYEAQTGTNGLTPAEECSRRPTLCAAICARCRPPPPSARPGLSLRNTTTTTYFFQPTLIVNMIINL